MPTYGRGPLEKAGVRCQFSDARGLSYEDAEIELLCHLLADDYRPRKHLFHAFGGGIWARRRCRCGVHRSASTGFAD
ncbi:MAG: hypothetical protein AAGC63_16775 [Propionicimonas sp.]